MGLKLTTGELRDDYFRSGLMKLAHFNFKSPKVAYNVAKMEKSFRDAYEVSQGPFLKLAKTYAELDENGEIKTPKGAPEGAFRIRDDAKVEWEAAFKEFASVEVELVGTRVSLADAVAAGVVPMELARMEPILNALEDVSAGETAKS